MTDDYLWDPKAPPDPAVERLEAVLGRLRTPLPPLELPRDLERSNRKPALWSMRFLGPALAAAAAIALMVGASWRTTHTSASWQVARIDGAPKVVGCGAGLQPCDEQRIAVGQTLITDSTSRARMDVGTIGEVTIDPDSRVRLVATRDGHHQLALDRGTLRASIVAPPGQFIVDTPTARATDLGCAYTLHVDEEGGGIISVTAGWVAFELNGRESFVPAGASCRTDRQRGLGTPRYDNESQAYRDALDDFDFGDPARRSEALHRVLALGGNGDAVTLWHLIPRVDAADRGAVVDALADQAAMPDGVTRDAVLRLDKAALDRWWDALGLGDTSWWRMWKKPVP